MKIQNLKCIILYMLTLLMTHPVSAQELRISVELDRTRVNRPGIDHITQLPKAIEDYINRHKWTEFRFLEQEQIRINMRIILENVDESFNFSATVILSTDRPIHGTIQNTPILFINDSWAFNYAPNVSFLHDEMQFDPVASYLDYYAYLILGYDFDSFSELGGSAFFKKAAAIVDLAQGNSGDGGWARGVRRGRFNLINNLMTGSYEGLRSAYYEYHRLGLDLFTEDPKQARLNIKAALEKIRDAKRITTEEYPFDIFFNAKFREIVAVFKDDEMSSRLQIYELLTNVDPGNISKYDELTSG